MKAYKCDICKNYFEKKYHKIHTAIDPMRTLGHHTLQLMLRRDKGPDIIVFDGDICPDCYGLLCEQLVARGCTEKEVLASASDYRKALDEADTSVVEHVHETDADIMDYLRMNAGRPMGYYDDLIDYLSQFDESDVVKVKYVRQKIEAAIGENIDWYERRKS